MNKPKPTARQRLEILNGLDRNLERQAFRQTANGGSSQRTKDQWREVQEARERVEKRVRGGE
jgi:hypothetical protein